jgi:arylsulfatase A-like enzyme
MSAGSRGSKRGSYVVSILLCVIALAEAAISPAAIGGKPDAARINLIIVVADDLGWGDLGCYGNPDLDTPVLDGLARAGVRLTACYSPSPLCSPARAGFLTGRWNHRTGAVDVSSNRGVDRIDLSERTIGDHFRAAGYATADIGKWHSGLNLGDYLPHRRGFDRFVGFANGAHDFEQWQLERRTAAADGQPETCRGEPHDGRHLSDVLEQRIRVPGIVAWPGHIPAGTVIDTPVHGCDWLPTALAACSIRAVDGSKPLDGVSLLPLLTGDAAAGLADRPLYFQPNRYTPVEQSNAALRHGRWKLVWPLIPETMRKDIARDNPCYDRGLTHAHWEMPLACRASRLCRRG